ncbi:TAXI family TRAP transporter solute-binding subunit [Roseibium aggregatum]|uniref:TAXI family TRAP transporter solute-binding subunit n=1 Tax=Roseibium aggregatum TaxID=187304 RepID=A0A926P2H2_9HYPH|nr:TAXI family TRAP transporter solute-binding subunit [Roseibium aggregatum]MBD1548343.1 TAXI family TRAP transporter solute-binding subunit [Roseibium aggregatum]
MTRFFKAAAFAAATVAMVAAGSAQAQNVGIATSNPGSLFHNIGTAVANAANEAGLNTTIQPATSPNQFIPFVNSGGIEFGVANLQEVNYAVSGEAWWNGVKNPNIRVVGMLMPLKEAIFVRADSDIKTLADLKGKRMTDGYTAQNTILPQLDAVYATADMTRADMTPVNVTSVVAGAQAFMANDADGFIFAHGAGKVREADASVGGLRALPVADDSDEALAKARKHWPTAFFVKMKAGSSPGVLEDATYIAFPQVIFTHAGVPDDVVYQMAKAMYEGKDVMAKTFKPFNAFNPKDMKGDPGVAEFHPGALKFFKEVGLD